MELLIILVLSAVCFSGLIYFAYRQHRQDQERHKVYQQWAAQHPGWTYRAGYDCALYHRYQFLKPLRSGLEHNAIQDVFEGKWRNHISKAFTFHYTSATPGTHTTSHHYFGIVLIHVHGTFPRLSIRPAGVLHKVGLHHNPLVLLSKEFDQKFVVQTTDKQFARHFCHGAMMQYLLRFPKLCFDVDRDVFMILQNYGRLEVDSIEPCLEHLYQICQIGLLDGVES